MQIAVLIEPIGTAGFRARGCEPFGVSAEGATQEEALGKLRESIASQLGAGARIVPLEIPFPDNPWLRMAGMFDQDDPLVKDWIEIMKQNRHKDDEEEGKL